MGLELWLTMTLKVVFYQIAYIFYKTFRTLLEPHTGPSFNTGTENTIQVSKFKRIGFDKKWWISMGVHIQVFIYTNC